MIDLSALPWQQQMARAITNPYELVDLLSLPVSIADAASRVNNNFALKVTHDFLSCIKKGDPHDPLLRQVLPLEQENHLVAGYTDDPVGDLNASISPGLIHKYHSRVLLITTPACAINCRYCFRREYPYQSDSANGKQLATALQQLGQSDRVNEVILSGGDPLSMSDSQLEILVKQLENIEQLEILRIHSRLPVVLPDRINSNLQTLLSGSRFQVVLVIHCNHPNELSDKVSKRLHSLATHGITLLNQSVLLSGVNDNADVLARLSRKLFQASVLPYYLHMLDPVSAAAHFDVETETALELHKQISRLLPGYLVPRLVREIEGGEYKESVY